ncbi:nuclear transport factor 2 family protein [Salinibacter ruber]|jgi:ketosteroid isomerase-like protein|uniref:Ketosteroid isomerase-like protein n=1 Tax=Salinibacter ruber TaxID=146919 RepID=A0A9X2Z3R6_9BACT|nr:nuclear transport factor 2 family protein [Salinibacter ruber]MCS3658545.1 ketosteroid isomerase-like protein [Salinibacter ruber]MCS3951814.1 ketosteroid isomerase-like protein [Salinibacter ruber]MCS4118174.1 ketosteroid isomerase-like protein [Salinibacter ruber]MCS4154462.1 ketosteroid isomerase-like protein [Salinibacter ruber]MCS4172097.1 ketosteroid isomerase-like protein [Salinibacter ruber]
MYHAIVRRIARNAFEDLSDQKVEPLIERSAPDLRHTFAGDHALGGTRHSREAFRAWLERLFRLFPELTFTIRDVMATGPPWDTRLAISWIDRGTAADGVDYENEGVHLLRLEWGRLQELEATLDTQHLEKTLDRMAAAGIEEAASDPIESADPSEGIDVDPDTIAPDLVKAS